MADQAASFRQQRATRLLQLCAVGKFSDAAFECCASSVNPLVLQQQTQAPFAAGGTIAWIEPLQITPQYPPKISTGLCVRLCAVFQRYAFGRGQVIFDIGFGPDERIFDIVADSRGYHLVGVPKQPGSIWVMAQLPDPPQLCKVRVECHLAQHSKQVLVFPVPPHIDHGQTNVSFKTYPEGIPVLAQGSSTEKAYFVVAEQMNQPLVSAEFSFTYTRRVLTVQTLQMGQRPKMIHLHETIAKICLSYDPSVFNWNELQFQNYLNSTGMRRAPGEDEVMFGRRVQQHIAATVTYAPTTTLSKSGGAAAVCMQRELDAAGHAVLFVSILRANQIPARVLIGHWVSQEIQPAQHYRAEFFVDNVGWIPVETIEKGESLYFGSDAKAPFVVVSFGEMTSTFRVSSSTQYAYKDRLPPNVTLAWREPHFVSLAGIAPGMSTNMETWVSAIGAAGSSMPNLPGSAHQQPTTQRYSKAHEGGAPSVGARQRPYAASVGGPSSSYAYSQPAPAVPQAYAAPPPVPPRQHAHSSVQFTTFAPIGGYAGQPHTNTQQPPPLPPHQSYGPPQLPPHQQQYAPGPHAGPPPQLPPQQNLAYGGPPPNLPPHQQYATNPGAPGPYNPQAGAYNPNGQPPALPPQQHYPPPQQQHQGGYGAPPQQQGYGAPPSLPPQNLQQQPPQNQAHYGAPPPVSPRDQQYQQYGNQQQQFGGNMMQAPPPSSTAPPMHVGSAVQPRPVSVAPQQHLANLESSHASSTLESAQAQGTASHQLNPPAATAGATKKAPVKVPVLPAGPVAANLNPVANNPQPNQLAPAAAKPSAAKGAPGKMGVPLGAPKKGTAAPAAGGPVSPRRLSNAGPQPSLAAGGPVSPRRHSAAQPPVSPRTNNGPKTFARAMFEHSPQDHLELPLEKGDIIEIVSEDDSGWWKAIRLGQQGIVPAPYLEKLPSGTKVAKTNFPFDAAEPTDLKLQVGEYAIIHQNQGDWWQAEAHGAQGNVPSNYVELC